MQDIIDCLIFQKKNESFYVEENRQYKNLNKSDAINDCIDVVSDKYTKWIFGWLEISSKEKDFILLSKFEDLVTKPKQEFKRILDFYEINLEDPIITLLLMKHVVKNMRKIWKTVKFYLGLFLLILGQEKLKWSMSSINQI